MHNRCYLFVGALASNVKYLSSPSGKTVTIFPQGHRCPSVNPATTPIRHGAGLIAYHAKCDVIPVCINIKKAKYALFRKTEIIFGEPIKYDELGFDQGGRDEYERATNLIFEHIVNLGDYSSLPDYDPSSDKKKSKLRNK